MNNRKSTLQFIEIPSYGIDNEIMSLLLLDERVILYVYPKNIIL